MLFKAEHKIDKEMILRAPKEIVAERTKNGLTLMLARALEEKVEIQIEDEGFTEKHSLAVVVLSEKQAQEISEIVSTFASYAKTYPAMYAIQDKLDRIQEIFLGDSLE